MHLNKLSFKISLFVGLLITVAVLVIASVIIISERKQIKEEVLDHALVFADYASLAIYDDYIQFYTHPSESDFQKFKELFSQKVSSDPDIVRVKLVGVNGVVLFDSEELETGRHGSGERRIDNEVLEMVKTSGLNMRETRTGAEITRSIDELSGTHVLSVYYEVSFASVQAALTELYGQVGLLLVPVLIGSTLFAVFFSLSITKPLANLAIAAKKIQQGEVGISVERSSNDEVGDLTESFNQMSANLARQIRKIHEDDAKLNASINSLSLGFIMIDITGKIIMINPVSQLMLNLKERPENLDDIKPVLGKLIDIEETLKVCTGDKKPVTTRDIEFNNHYFDALVTPIIETNNSCLGTVILLNDTTEAKILDRSKDEFFSIASHELRTPLTAIMGNVDILRDYYKEKVKDQEITEIVEDIEKSSERMINIVNDFLDLSRLEVGNIEFQNAEIEVEKLIVDTIQEFQVMSSRKKLYLEFKKPEEALPKIFADPNKVRRVLVNLISNGFKFTKEGGVLVNATEKGGHVTVSVSDTGMGISPENQKYLFRKFQQAGDSIYARDVTQGTGLGLYISKLIIEGMGGSIWLESSISGKGSVFSFKLPIKKNG